MKTILLCFTAFYLGCTATNAQKTYQILRLTAAPLIDGVADDSLWQQIPVADGFTTTLPRSGQTPQLPTIVKMAFDDRGIFISAVCKSGKIRNEGSNRDDNGTGDYFSVGFDTWNDDQHAFVFTVTAGGQIIDQRESSTQTETGFETAWKARTSQLADSWTVEMWIPFTAMRFPVKGSQNWGVQFTRFDRSTGETSTWSPQDPTIKDVVWQYGQLEGLVTPKRQVRLGLSILRQTKGYSNYTYFPARAIGEDYFDIDLAVDGRIGFNSASTLDFSVLPVINIIKSGIFYSPGNSFLEDLLYNDVSAEMPSPRMFTTEESGIAHKTPTYWESPSFSTNDLTALLKLPPGQIAYSRQDYRVIQSSRFTTRTRSNWGIAVSNSIFNRPVYTVYETSNGPFEYTLIGEGKYPTPPVYNHIAVEKTFRNNSWIQASTGNLLTGKGENINNSAAGVQWRDITNRFEAGGHFVLYTQFVSAGSPYSRAEGQAHIGKINGKHRWNLNYQSPVNGAFGFLNSPSGIRQSFDFPHRINASVTELNFKPKLGYFQNTQQSIIATAALGGNNYQNDRWLVAWNWAGLDNVFRSLSARLSTSPEIARETLDFSSIQLYGKRSLPVNLSVSGSTDTRKKSVLHYGTGLLWRPQNWQLSPILTCSPAWVLGKKWIINLNNTVHLPTKGNRVPLISTEKYVFERSSTWGYENQTFINFNPSRKWTFAVQLNFSSDILYQRKPFEILTTGQKVPANVSLSPTSDNKSFGGSFDVNWNYTPIKHFRFRFLFFRGLYEHPTNFQTPASAALFVTERDQAILEWSWVWNMNNRP